MNFDRGRGLSAKCPRPKEILDLSYWNTSDDLVRKAHDIWSETYEQVRRDYLEFTLQTSAVFEIRI